LVAFTGISTNLKIHGMANTSPERVIEPSDLSPALQQAAMIWTGVFGGIEIETSKADAILAHLKKAEHLPCWRKAKITAKLQF